MKQHHANFIIETPMPKKNTVSKRNQRFEAFFVASNFNLPLSLNFNEENSHICQIYFDKVTSSNNFYCALDEPILPQIAGKYSIVWNFRVQCDKLLKANAIIRTDIDEKIMELIVTSELVLFTFEPLISCKGFASGDGIICEINTESIDEIKLITNKLEIEYDSPL